jgi:PAS domain-containing protein
MVGRGKSEDLRTLLALHAIALGTMSHGVCVLDSKGRLVLFNKRMLELLNLSSETVCVGMSFRAVLELGVARGYYTRKAFKDTWSECNEKLNGSNPFVLIHRFSSFNFRPINSGGWVVICDELTDDARTARKLEQQVDSMRQAVNHMSQGLCLFDVNERLVFCNEQYLCIYGFDSAVVKAGITYRQLLDYAVRSGKHTNVNTEKLYERCIVLAREQGPVSHQIRLSDGKVIETTFRRISTGGWVAVHEDVTFRIRQQEALQERNLLLDATLENMAHGLCAYDRDLRLICANRSYLEIYGLRAEDAQPGVTLLQLMETSIGRGVHVPHLTAMQMFEDYKRRLIESKDPVLYRELADGRRATAFRKSNRPVGAARFADPASKSPDVSREDD